MNNLINFPSDAASHKKKALFRELTKPIPYDRLNDPALEEFYSRPSVQKHLLKNEWVFLPCLSSSLPRTRNVPFVTALAEKSKFAVDATVLFILIVFLLFLC